jgi:hypothetical protein
MRFTFPNGEHDPIELGRGSLSIGSDPGDSACLKDAGLKPGHARIELQPERRLCALRLAPGALAYVNARPVRSLALLRAGDVVMLNRLRMQVQSAIATPAAEEVLSPQPRDGGPRIVLRCVAGAQFGRSYRFEPSLSLGRSERADLCIDDEELAPIHVRLHWLGDRCLAKAEGEGQSFEMNGQAVSLAWMLPGDQLRVGSARFVLEAPGLRSGRREDPHTPVQPMRAVSAAAVAGSAAVPVDSRGFNFGWLILAALAIAGGLVAMFLYAPR